MPKEITPQQRRRFYIILLVAYLALVGVAVLLVDRLPWFAAGMGGLGAALLLAAVGGWWRRHQSNPENR